MRNHNPTPWPLLAGLQTVLWAVLALCVGNAFGSLTLDPLDLPKADSADTARIREVAEAQSAQILALEEIGYSAEDCVGRELLTTDPMDQFWDSYSYVGGDPLTATDPWGLFSDGQGSLDMTSPGVFSGGDFTGPGIDLSNIGLSMPLLGTDLTLGNVLNNSRQAAQDAANRAALMGQISRGDESAMMRAGVPIPGGDDPGMLLAGMGPLLSWVGNGIKGMNAGMAITGYRYMSLGELGAIRNTGMLRGGNPGETFFTKDVYKSALKAQQRLALPSTPALRVEFEIQNSVSLARNGTKVLPTFTLPGGGAEFMTTNQVMVKVINWQKLAP